MALPISKLAPQSSSERPAFHSLPLTTANRSIFLAPRKDPTASLLSLANSALTLKGMKALQVTRQLQSPSVLPESPRSRNAIQQICMRHYVSQAQGSAVNRTKSGLRG